MKSLPSIEPFEKRFEELDQRLADPSVFENPRFGAELSREHQKLAGLLARYRRWERLKSELSANRELLEDPDPAMGDLAREEAKRLEDELGRIEVEILQEMVPSDPSDSRNTIVEIRAGAGGGEAALFAADLHRMYYRYAENKGWSVEPLGSSSSEVGGFKEVTFLIKGDQVYRSLKFESGVHRVQRVPVTESGGRIHTSTATVAVLPEAEEVDVEIKPDDLEITVARASGPGGQGVNTTDSAVQIVHKPSGITVNCADERSQLKNKAKALQVLRSRLLRQREEEERAKYAADRRNQVGTGDRSERIRTYNFPQSRLTDHRIGLTLQSLEEILSGNLDPVVEVLLASDEQVRIEVFQTSSADSEHHFPEAGP